MQSQLEQLPEEIAQLGGAFSLLRAEIGKAVIGQEAVIEAVLAALLAGGHCLLQGVPGLAKTLLVQSLGQALALDFRRVQFTPDLMPGDITGSDILDEEPGSGRRELRFIPGPVFTNLLLADEINRTPPKTQAALLEAMQERQVSNHGVRNPLPRPFFVLATQNPIEQEGTYPLPEAQLDRFMFLIKLTYPERDQEIAILRETTGNSRPQPQPVLDAEMLLHFQKCVRSIPVSDHVIAYCADLARMSRPENPDAPDFIRERDSGRACLQPRKPRQRRRSPGGADPAAGGARRRRAGGADQRELCRRAPLRAGGAAPPHRLQLPRGRREPDQRHPRRKADGSGSGERRIR